MIDIKPFVPKIYLEYPDHIVWYPSVDDYKESFSKRSYYYARDRIKYTDSDPYYVCAKCELSHIKASNFSPKCYVGHREIDWEATKNARNDNHWNYYRYKTVIREVPGGHSLVPVVKLRNELGDSVELYPQKSVAEQNRLRDQRNYENWMEGRYSPDNRGILESEQNRIEAEKHGYKWSHDYRHAIARRPANSYYRQVRTFNEHKQYAACLVDEHSPAIRGKRKPSTIPCHWDDRYPHYDKSWKNKKVRKQWMINQPDRPKYAYKNKQEFFNELNDSES